MSGGCEHWEVLAAGDPATHDAERDLHLAACAECREQWSAHATLARLADEPRPSLSRDLGPILGRAVAELAPPGGLLSPRQRLLMRLYWLAATFAAGLVLAQLGPASTAWLFFWACLGALALAGLPAFLLLRRRLSWGLMDLVVWTLR